MSSVTFRFQGAVRREVLSGFAQVAVLGHPVRAVALDHRVHRTVALVMAGLPPWKGTIWAIEKKAIRSCGRLCMQLRAAWPPTFPWGVFVY